VDDYFAPGYPTDLRPEVQRIKKALSTTGDFEFHAARVIARYTGEHVIIQDDGSQNSMPDFLINYRNKPAGYGEAVIDIDPRYAAMSQRISQEESIPAARTWWVNCTGASPKLKDFRPKLVELLGQLTSAPSPEIRQKLADMRLRVQGPWSAPTGRPNVIHLLPEGVTGQAIPNWDAFLQWIADFLTCDRTGDVRRKLAATRAAERHAFIAASFTTPGDAYFALGDEGHAQLPPRRPRLPPEITHLWAWSVPGIGRCLAWFPHTGWIDPAEHWATP
jgi:hypothetical protein